MDNCENCQKEETLFSLDCNHKLCSLCLGIKREDVKLQEIERQNNEQSSTKVRCPLDKCLKISDLTYRVINQSDQSENESFEIIETSQNSSDQQEENNIQSNQNLQNNQEAFQYQVDELNIQKSKLEEEAKMNKLEIQELVTQKQQLQEKLSQEQNEKINLQNEKKNFQISQKNLNEEIKNLKKEKQQMQHYINQVQSTNENLSKENQNLIRQKDQNLNIKQDIEQQLLYVQNQLSQEKQKYEQQAQQHQNAIKNLNQQLDIKEHEIIQKVKILEQKNIILESEKKKIIEDLKQQNLQAQNQKQLFDQTLQQLQCQNQNKDNEIRQLKASLDEYLVQNENLKSSLFQQAQQQINNEILIQNYQNAQNMLQSYACQIEQLQNEKNNQVQRQSQLEYDYSNKYNELSNEFSNFKQSQASQNSLNNQKFTEQSKENQDLKYQLLESQKKNAQLQEQINQILANQSQQQFLNPQSQTQNQNPYVQVQFNQIQQINQREQSSYFTPEQFNFQGQSIQNDLQCQKQNQQKLECDNLNCTKRSAQVYMMNCYHSFCCECLKIQVNLQTGSQNKYNQYEKGQKIYCPNNCGNQINPEIIQKILGQETYQKDFEEAQRRRI